MSYTCSYPGVISKIISNEPCKIVDHIVYDTSSEHNKFSPKCAYIDQIKTLKKNMQICCTLHYADGSTEKAICHSDLCNDNSDCALLEKCFNNRCKNTDYLNKALTSKSMSNGWIIGIVIIGIFVIIVLLIVWYVHYHRKKKLIAKTNQNLL